MLAHKLYVGFSELTSITGETTAEHRESTLFTALSTSITERSSVSDEETSVASETASPFTTQTTTKQYCEHMEYIDTLVASKVISTVTEDIPNKEDFIRKGVDFHGTNPIIVIDIPEDGAIIRDVALPSNNIERIRVTLTTVSDITLPAIEGAPTDLPSDQFPTEKIDVILIEILSTFDNKAPRGVTISVVACAPGITTSTTKGNWIEFNVYNE